MSDHVGTEPPRSQPRTRTEYRYLALGTVTLTVCSVLYVVDHTTTIDMRQGTYQLLSSLAVVGLCGWIVRSSDLQRQRVVESGAVQLVRQVADLGVQLEQLRKLIRQQLPASRVAGSCPAAGRTYASAAAVGDTVPLLPRVDEGTRGRGGGRLVTDYWTVYSDVMEDLAGIERDPPPDR
ncbi:hypothetical protein [Micromonospora humidisoli]|uniref:SMODS and SLOG-associating 2TM effector domain-containing protein n=1 Tax=Micromonospora humidisoli TaxID=2807622 RepID=A0ABS2JAK3_9ACTN|nr:hypothetical protein [Micromonospora humidisoli]MBM7083586.1 hypothetical protein [Micromonospora humidisoli]